MSRLYLSHFGLNEAPFSITPNPAYFFAASGRGPLLQALAYSVSAEEGIVTVVGEVGSGKTMLCRMLLETLPVDVDSIYLSNPSFAPGEVLDAIAADLGLPRAQVGDAPGSRLGWLQEALIRRHADGRRVVLIVDEAHAMPPASLEEVRLLSNLETSHHKLLQIVLFGQPELDQVLARPDLRQLRDRIVQRFDLCPLARDDARDYLSFRLQVAGRRDGFPFEPAAVRDLWKEARGLTRRINLLADKALMSAFARNAAHVSRADVKRAVGDLPAAVSRTHPWWRRLSLSAALAALMAVAVVGLAWLRG